MTRRVNLETQITHAIRDALNLMGVKAHWKHWAGRFSRKGVPDIVATIPGGRALYIEVKTPSGVVSAEQEAFMRDHLAAGALVIVARDAREVAEELALAGYEPAKRLLRGMR
jgi:hypothetical protein